jgi:hypothetical protein
VFRFRRSTAYMTPPTAAPTAMATFQFTAPAY